MTALGLAAEIGDWSRFTGATIGAYVGLVPSESSSGEHVSRGHITKAGNRHVRRLLVEAAWHYRRPYRLSRELVRRRVGQRPDVLTRANQGNRRLTQRWAGLAERKKEPKIIATSIARELAGWCWSLAVMPD